MSHQQGFISIILILIIVAALAGIAGFVLVEQLPSYTIVSPETKRPVACTEEAKQCSDGSYVSRTGPNCEFAECPTPRPTPNPTPPPAPASQCNVQPDQYGNCPAGCVNYGMPLGCVTPEYSDYCKTHSCPICLAENTLIDTPIGTVAVQSLKEGMAVWTVDIFGNRVVATIIKTSKTPVPKAHQMVHVILEDGREIFASPGHPLTDGRIFNNLSVGDTLDGSTIKVTERVNYDKGYTYDILPSGTSGSYWANGILIGSTLK